MREAVLGPQAQYVGYGCAAASNANLMNVNGADAQTIASFSVSSTGAREEDAPPPEWTQGTFSDPLYEKMRQAHQANVDYGLTR